MSIYSPSVATYPNNMHNVMDALFTVEEMGMHCFRENSRTTKPGLDMKRVKLLEGWLHNQCYVCSPTLCILTLLIDCVKQIQVWKREI